MAVVELNTLPPSEHLVSRYRRASSMQRCGAIMVDILVFCAFVATPAWLISWAFGPGGMTGCGTAAMRNGNLADDTCLITPEALRFTRIVFYSLWVVWVLVYSRSIARGASMGKRAVEIMVIDATTGDTISYRRALGRTVLSILSFACFGLGILVSLTNRDRRTAHDLVMGTRVISP